MNTMYESTLSTQEGLAIDPTKVVIPSKSQEEQILDESKDSSNRVIGEKVILDDTNAPKVLVYRYPKKDKFIVPDATEYKKKLRQIQHRKNKQFTHDTKKEMMKNFKEGYHKKHSTITLCTCPNNEVPKYLKIANKLFADKGYNIFMVRDGNLVDVVRSLYNNRSYQCRIVLTV